MTFTEIVTEVSDRLGVTASSDTTRIGRAVNRKYRELTTSIGIPQTSRRSSAASGQSVGSSSLAFTSTEKIINVHNRNVSPYQVLKEVTLDELYAQRPYPISDFPTEWAVFEMRADTVWIDTNARAANTYNLHADIYAAISDLSGSNEPLFPESFHDILYHGVLIDEYLKIEKLPLAQISSAIVEKRMGELRLWLAVSMTKDIYQNKLNESGGFITRMP